MMFDSGRSNKLSNVETLAYVLVELCGIETPVHLEKIAES